jgi:hypothetical protein
MAIIIPLLAPLIYATTIPPKIDVAINHLIGMITAIVLMALFVSFGLIHSFYLFIFSIYTSFLVAFQLTLPWPSRTSLSNHHLV